MRKQVSPCFALCSLHSPYRPIQILLTRSTTFPLTALNLISLFYHHGFLQLSSYCPIFIFFKSISLEALKKLRELSTLSTLIDSYHYTVAFQCIIHIYGVFHPECLPTDQVIPRPTCMVSELIPYPSLLACFLCHSGIDTFLLVFKFHLGSWRSALFHRTRPLFRICCISIITGPPL